MTPLNPPTPAVTVLGISGSPRPKGNSRFLLELALQSAAEAGKDRVRTELYTITALVNHTLVMGGVPVTGDPWESYIGAAGWTACSERKDGLQKLAEAGDRDAQATIRASTLLCRRVAQMALLIRAGGMAQRAELEADGGYSIFLDRLLPSASITGLHS
jgi:hypothetical protein